MLPERFSALPLARTPPSGSPVVLIGKGDRQFVAVLSPMRPELDLPESSHTGVD